MQERRTAGRWAASAAASLSFEWAPVLQSVRHVIHGSGSGRPESPAQTRTGHPGTCSPQKETPPRQCLGGKMAQSSH